jgi:tripeptide aminopeptidase
MKLEQNLLDRFLRYVQIHTTSDRHSASVPSTERQFDLAKLLVEELREMGLEDVYLDEKCYVIARIPAGSAEYEAVPTIGFMAHVDTAADMSGENVKPQVWEQYDGGVIELGPGHRMDPETYPALLEYEGKTIITSDGTTLLGADDKAGVSEIMSAAAYVLEHPEIPHGEIELIFTSDEETGHGMDNFPLDKIRSKICYTMDGGDEGLVEAECFNAFKVSVDIQGSVIHIGDARGKLANAVSMAGAFLAGLPRSESPEATDGPYGYYCPIEVGGNLDHAHLEVYLRDFEIEGIKRRLSFLRSLAQTVEQAFPGGTITLTEEQQYLNMRDALSEHPEALELLREAIRRTGIEPQMHAIRGGTDGARLTQMGVPTPNVFAGGHNMHSRDEWVALQTMVRASEAIVNLVQLWAEQE